MLQLYVSRASKLVAVYFLGASTLFATSAVLAEGTFNEPVAKALRAPDPAPQPTLATIFVARKIVTIEPKHPSGEAVAVSGKRIIAVGTLDEVKKALGDRPYKVDETLKSKIVMPGFIDQHLHPILGALTLAVDVIAPEDWVLPGKTFKAATSEADYRARLKIAEAAVERPQRVASFLGLSFALARQARSQSAGCDQQHTADRRLAALLSRIHPQHAGAEGARPHRGNDQGQGYGERAVELGGRAFLGDRPQLDDHADDEGARHARAPLARPEADGRL